MNEGEIVEERIWVLGRRLSVWFATSSGVDTVLYAKYESVPECGRISYVIHVLLVLLRLLGNGPGCSHTYEPIDLIRSSLQ